MSVQIRRMATYLDAHSHLHDHLSVDVFLSTAGSNFILTMKSLKQKIIWYAKLLFGITLLGCVLWQVDWRDFFDRILEISIPFFAFLVLCSITDRFLMGYKWNLLLRAQGLYIPTFRVVSLYFISNLLGVFTPGNLGADAYRVLALSSFHKNSAVLSTVILERAIGMLVLLFFVIGSLPFSYSLFGKEGSTVTFVAFVGSLLILLILFLPLYPPLRSKVDRILTNHNSKLSLKIHQFLSVFAEQQKNWRIVFLFFVWTVIETTLFFYLSYLAAMTAGLHVSLAFIFSVMPAVIFVLRLPITILGIGLQEGLFVYIFSLADNSITQGVLVSLVWRMMDVIAVYIPGSLLFMFSPSVDDHPA